MFFLPLLIFQSFLCLIDHVSISILPLSLCYSSYKPFFPVIQGLPQQQQQYWCVCVQTVWHVANYRVTHENFMFYILNFGIEIRNILWNFGTTSNFETCEFIVAEKFIANFFWHFNILTFPYINIYLVSSLSAYWYGDKHSHSELKQVKKPLSRHIHYHWVMKLGICWYMDMLKYWNVERSLLWIFLLITQGFSMIE